MGDFEKFETLTKEVKTNKNKNTKKQGREVEENEREWWMWTIQRRVWQCDLGSSARGGDALIMIHFHS